MQGAHQNQSAKASAKAAAEIAALERELQKYKEIAAAYRVALGDVEANRILSYHFRGRMRELEGEQAILAMLRAVRTGGGR